MPSKLGGDTSEATESNGITDTAMPLARTARRVAVFGLGYVGFVSAACLARRGNTVVGVDISPDKVEMVNAGKPGGREAHR